MSMETEEWLNRFCLIGNTDKRGTAWHYRQSAQGTEPNHYPGFIPVDDVLRRLFNWQAVEMPIYLAKSDDISTAQSQHQLYTKINDRKAIVRSDDLDTVLGIFKDGYVPHPYDQWLLELVAEILGDELGITSAGLLQKGGLAWVEVSVPDTITTPEGVTFLPNLLAGTSFNGVLASTYKRSASETVCDNTMFATLGSEGQELKIRHSRYSGLRIADAREALALVMDTADNFSATVKTLCEIPVSKPDFSRYLDITIPTPEGGGRGATMAATKRETLEQLYTNDSRVAPWNGTAFGVLQMDNTYRHHYSIVRAAGKAERNMSNALLGTTGEADSKVLKTLAEIMPDKKELLLVGAAA